MRLGKKIIFQDAHKNDFDLYSNPWTFHCSRQDCSERRNDEESHPRNGLLKIEKNAEGSFTVRLTESNLLGKRQLFAFKVKNRTVRLLRQPFIKLRIGGMKIEMNTAKKPE